MAYVYRHTRIDTGLPFYIGIGNVEYNTVGQIWYQRASNRSQRSQHWKNITNKTEIEVEIMVDGISYEEAKKKEIEFIKLYGRLVDGGLLINRTIGGDGTVGALASDETKKKLSAIHKGRPATHLKGKKLSDEHRLKLSLAWRGRPSHRKGKKLSPEHTEKIRLALQKDHPFRGKKHTEESKRKVGEANSGKTPVLQFRDGILINEYANLIVCAAITGYSNACIQHVIKGRRKTYKGCTWQYKGEIPCKYNRTYKGVTK